MSQLISVIMPVFNEESIIEGTLREFEKQTYSNFELVIINDGSTDNTQQVIENYIKNKSNIKL